MIICYKFFCYYIQILITVGQEGFWNTQERCSHKATLNCKLDEPAGGSSDARWLFAISWNVARWTNRSKHNKYGRCRGT